MTGTFHVNAKFLNLNLFDTGFGILSISEGTMDLKAAVNGQLEWGWGTFFDTFGEAGVNVYYGLTTYNPLFLISAIENAVAGGVCLVTTYQDEIIDSIEKIQHFFIAAVPEGIDALSEETLSAWNHLIDDPSGFLNNVSEDIIALNPFEDKSFLDKLIDIDNYDTYIDSIFENVKDSQAFEYAGDILKAAAITGTVTLLLKTIVNRDSSFSEKLKSSLKMCVRGGLVKSGFLIGNPIGYGIITLYSLHALSKKYIFNNNIINNVEIETNKINKALDFHVKKLKEDTDQQINCLYDKYDCSKKDKSNEEKIKNELERNVKIETLEKQKDIKIKELKRLKNEIRDQLLYNEYINNIENLEYKTIISSNQGEDYLRNY